MHLMDFCGRVGTSQVLIHDRTNEIVLHFFFTSDVEKS